MKNRGKYIISRSFGKYSFQKKITFNVFTNFSLPEMRKVFSEMDAYMYMGHGSTLKNFSAQEIEKLNVRAVPLLFGCNSGKLERMGRLMDPIGNSRYFVALIV